MLSEAVAVGVARCASDPFLFDGILDSFNYFGSLILKNIFSFPDTWTVCYRCVI